MASYAPLKITGNSTGLVQEREEFLLPDDAYPKLENAYVWREKILRKKGFELLGRLQRNFPAFSYFQNPSGAYSINILNVSGYIRTTNTANPGRVDTKYAHGLSTGDLVVISGVVGATGYNNVTFTITVINTTAFTVGVNAAAFGAYVSGGYFTSNRSLLGLEPNASVVPGSVVYVIQAGTVRTLTDDGNGNLVSNVGGSAGLINYATGAVSITTNAGFPRDTLLTMSYYPGLPVMGIRKQELQNSANDTTIFFDQKYAYVFSTSIQAFQEYLTGTTWNASNATVAGVDFFWSTNYWVSDLTNFTTAGVKLFWVTNNTGGSGNPDPIRITDRTTWINFQPPTYGQIDATNYLVGCLAFLPFRGRMVAFNTYEGGTLSGSTHYSNRIRWSTIGNPFLPFAAGPPSTGSWRDDIRGQGGFLDIPTAEDIVSVGFVRDNLVIYCERSTWQLRYTGRSIAPFQIERVNSELGVEGTFSGVQFDTSLVGIGDKGVVECDSYKSERIDVKIPDLVFKFNGINDGQARVHGIRDFVNRLAYWTYPLESAYDPAIPSASQIFCNERLVYNYENDSWAIFTDSLTCLGEYQEIATNLTWLQIKKPWKQLKFPWISQASESPLIVGGNQQGFIEILDTTVTNDVSLFISNITGDAVTPAATLITCPNHNMSTGFVIEINGLISTDPFVSLNGGIFSIIVKSANTFSLSVYDATTGEFSTPQINAAGTYLGAGLINIRENFSIVSKKFNFMDEGRAIQIGYLDILMNSTSPSDEGAISLNMYLDYNDSEASNTVPKNDISDVNGLAIPDTFFNSVIPTTQSTLNMTGGTKFWQRVYCATQSNFLTLEYTFSNAQMAGTQQELDVQIDAQILWIRKAGQMSQI